jgi:hypothetical protein
MTMGEDRDIGQFNQKLDRILQGLPPGRGDLPVEDRNVLALARSTAQIDLSCQSKVKAKLRQSLEAQAIRRLPHTSNFSTKFLFKTGRLSWIVLIALVQLVLGSVFGYMVASSQNESPPRLIGCVTPPAQSYYTQSPVPDTAWWMAQNFDGSVSNSLIEYPRPIPTPLATTNNKLVTQETYNSSATPLNIDNSDMP